MAGSESKVDTPPKLDPEAWGPWPPERSERALEDERRLREVGILNVLVKLAEEDGRPLPPDVVAEGRLELTITHQREISVDADDEVNFWRGMSVSLEINSYKTQADPEAHKDS